jgi:phosphoglycerate dehydrogenase-like enzyme
MPAVVMRRACAIRVELPVATNSCVQPTLYGESREMTSVAILPEPVPEEVRIAVTEAGGFEAPPSECQALIWLGGEPQKLSSTLRDMPQIRWVQLPWAGVEWYLPLMRTEVTWTSGSGVLADSVAEHALMLAMVALRNADRSVRTGHWLPQPPRSLFDSEVLVVGAGSTSRALLRLLGPMRVRATVLRRRAGAVLGAQKVVGMEDLVPAVSRSDVVFLTAALTPLTHRMIAAPVLSHMKRSACLVNVARGALIDTNDLVEALREGWISAAALDTTDPEPLPLGHALWRASNCFITAHSAGDLPYAWPAFARLVNDNINRFKRNMPLRNVVSVDDGY